MAFKDRLKKLRNEKGITQEVLANKTGIPGSTIRRYESMEEGYPGKKRMEAIADYFGVSIDYLYGRNTDGEVHKQITGYKRKLIEEVESLNDEDAKDLYHIVKKIRK